MKLLEQLTGLFSQVISLLSTTLKIIYKNIIPIVMIIFYGALGYYLTFYILEGQPKFAIWMLVIGVIMPFVSTFAGYFMKRTSVKRTSKTRKKYPKLSIVAIINQYSEQDVFKSIYLLLIAIITYIFAAQIFSFAISINFLIIFFSLILLFFLYLLVFNFRISQGWYGGNESEARDIINFAINNSDIDLTDDGKSKPIITQEDIEELCVELGIPIPGFLRARPVNQDLA